MTQEEKQLLLKDLCARLPYRVIIDYKENEFEIPHWKITTIYPDTFDGWIGYDRRVGAGLESGSRPFKIGEVKPYLRPMDSMTEEEETLFRCELPAIAKTDAQLVAMRMELFLKGHLDFNHLIEKGLALEAPEGMYKEV